MMSERDALAVKSADETYVARIAAALTAVAADIDERVPLGDCAGLRRGWQQGAGPAFWRLAVRHLDPRRLALDTDEEQRWVAIVAGLVETKGLPRRGRGFGAAAAAAGVTEHRLLRLLRGRDVESTLQDFRGAIVQVARAGHGFDWRDLAFLLLLPDQERSRRKIARDYYRAIGPNADQRLTNV